MDYFENNRQNIFSHLKLVILENSQFLLIILTNDKQTRKIVNLLLVIYRNSKLHMTWQEENKRLLFSITGMDDQFLDKRGFEASIETFIVNSLQFLNGIFKSLCNSIHYFFHNHSLGKFSNNAWTILCVQMSKVFLEWGTWLLTTIN